jgi:hypothetical protein
MRARSWGQFLFWPGFQISWNINLECLHLHSPESRRLKRRPPCALASRPSRTPSRPFASACPDEAALPHRHPFPLPHPCQCRHPFPLPHPRQRQHLFLPLHPYQCRGLPRLRWTKVFPLPVPPQLLLLRLFRVRFLCQQLGRAWTPPLRVRCQPVRPRLRPCPARHLKWRRWQRIPR